MSTQPPNMPPKISLTLIVATTPTLGIGYRSSLPWRLKSEMAYFARVTQRLPPTTTTSSTSTTTSTTNTQHKNAVIMGRKTWESIPPKFRPLKNRTNVVLSRDEGWIDAHKAEGFNGANSLRGAVELLNTKWSSSPPSSGDVPRAYIIGGAEVYRSALEMPETDAVLLTRVFGEWECDAFFPVDLDGDEGWRRASLGELREFTGEEGLSGETVKEGDAEFEYRLYRRVV